MLHKNFNIKIIGEKIIALKEGSTPGIYKIFDVKDNTNYNICLENFNKGNTKLLLLWIADLNSKLISINKITQIDELKFNNKLHKKIKIGILFKSHNRGDYFFLKNIELLPIEKNLQKQEIFNNSIQNTKSNLLNHVEPKTYSESQNKKNDLQKKYFQHNEKNILTNQDNTISVVIPCHYKHISYIKSLLEHYDNQTILPLEIIIVVSEAFKIQNNKLDELQKTNHKYNLKIIKKYNRSAAGNNRYIGTENSQGDIIIFQDADDIPHKQRLEIIKYFFNKYPDIVHICHQFTKKEDYLNKVFNISNINHNKLTSDNIFLNPYIRIPSKVTNGNVAIRKKIYKSLNWYRYKFRAQDVLFNSYTYNKYNKTLFIECPIYFYRIKLSVKNFI